MKCDGLKVAVQGSVCSPLNVLQVDDTVVNTMKDTELKLFRYYKPRNCIVTKYDPINEAPTIYNLLDPKYHNLVSVGRLDALTVRLRFGFIRDSYEIHSNPNPNPRVMFPTSNQTERTSLLQ